MSATGTPDPAPASWRACPRSRSRTSRREAPDSGADLPAPQLYSGPSDRHHRSMVQMTGRRPGSAPSWAMEVLDDAQLSHRQGREGESIRPGARSGDDRSALTHVPRRQRHAPCQPRRGHVALHLPLLRELGFLRPSPLPPEDLRGDASGGGAGLDLLRRPERHGLNGDRHPARRDEAAGLGPAASSSRRWSGTVPDAAQQPAVQLMLNAP